MHRAPPQCADLVRGLLSLGIVVQMAERDIGTLGGEGERGGTADAARSTGDQRDFSLQVSCLVSHASRHVAPDAAAGPSLRHADRPHPRDLRAGCASLRATHGALALVPTMGALHDGHRALVRAAAESGAAVATSIFVNPLQFGANEDLSRYPRDEASDLEILRRRGCHLVWPPDVATMYPPDDATTIDVAGPAEIGKARPGRGISAVWPRSARNCSAR